MKNTSYIKSIINAMKSLPDTTPSESLYGAIERSIKVLQSDIISSIEPYAFYACDSLKLVDLSSAINIGICSFAGCASLAALILRNTDSLCILGDDAFGRAEKTVIQNNSITRVYTSNLISKGAGYIYVPRALIEDYKATENWSAYASQFRALEDYTVDGTTTGELDESKI